MKQHCQEDTTNVKQRVIVIGISQILSHKKDKKTKSKWLQEMGQGEEW